ncbi:hypothetical protein [Mesorhizobium sp. L48C026A00]|uniref:hypothetical protein n=1 Tax=Mesorhizobium sp. L48C026A00 TaxID=1287182 RepID=UPI0012EC9269|nr:hypothetical protein [Mesorhizobium sp. L48C026A00]
MGGISRLYILIAGGREQFVNLKFPASPSGGGLMVASSIADDCANQGDTVTSQDFMEGNGDKDCAGDRFDRAGHDRDEFRTRFQQTDQLAAEEHREKARSASATWLRHRAITGSIRRCRIDG